MHVYVHLNMVEFWHVKLWYCIVQKFGNRKLWHMQPKSILVEKTLAARLLCTAKLISSDKNCWVMKLGRIVCELSDPLSFLPPVFYAMHTVSIRRSRHFLSMFYHVLYIIQCTFIYAYESKTVVVAKLARSTYLEYA